MLHTVLNLVPDYSIKPADVGLGVVLDNNTLYEISSIYKSCLFHLRRIWQVRKSLDETCLSRPTLVHVLVISRLDYCNAFLYGLAASVHPPTTYHGSPLCCKTHQKFESTWSCHPNPLLARLHLHKPAYISKSSS